MYIQLIEKETGKLVAHLCIQIFGFDTLKKEEEIFSKGKRTKDQYSVEFDNVKDLYKVVYGHIGKVATGKLLHFSSMCDCYYRIHR